MNKKNMNLKENKKDFEGGKRRERWLNYIIISELKEIQAQILHRKSSLTIHNILVLNKIDVLYDIQNTFKGVRLAVC